MGRESKEEGNSNVDEAKRTSLEGKEAEAKVNQAEGWKGGKWGLGGWEGGKWEDGKAGGWEGGKWEGGQAGGCKGGEWEGRKADSGRVAALLTLPYSTCPPSCPPRWEGRRMGRPGRPFLYAHGYQGQGVSFVHFGVGLNKELSSGYRFGSNDPVLQPITPITYRSHGFGLPLGGIEIKALLARYYLGQNCRDPFCLHNAS